MAEITIDQALHQGIEAYKEGQVQEADRFFTAILKAHPKHPDANHNMGVLAVGVGKVQEALPFFITALETNPSTDQFSLSYIDALIKLERLADAKAVFDQAKSNGSQGDSFDQLQKRLNVVSGVPVETVVDYQEIEHVQPNILNTLKLDQAIKLAKKKSKEGSSEESKCIYQGILVKFPKNKKAIDGLKGLAGTPVSKTSKVQDPSQDQVQSVINLYSQGQLQQALEQATVLLQQFPSSSFLHNICGVVYKGLGQLDTSVESYNKAIAIKSDYIEAFYNMGVTLKEQGKLEEAIKAYNKAIAIKPDYVEAFYNMGNALKDQGQLEEAIEAYNKALTIKPDYAEAYNNMGNALKGIAFTEHKPDLQKVITSLLDKKLYVRPKDIVDAAISLLKFEPELKRNLPQHPVAEVRQKPLEVIKDLSELTLLHKLMRVCPLPDLYLENLLRELRASLLLSISDLTGLPEELKFQTALALQCFTNEYIYNKSEHEDEPLAALEVIVKQALSNGDQPSPQSILCLASYRPLNQYDWSSSLLVTDEIEDVFTRQVVEPNQEAKFKSILPVLEDITDDVSSKVRDQYEVSPYPRWVNLRLTLNPAPISKVVEEIKLKLFDDKAKVIQSPNILIAGCGTGQHSIGTASRFKGSKVLAIDLSLSSLSYAKRKTEELGVQNIDYMQADILDLGKLGRQFDIVESAGVLHHMDDPVVGWRMLTDCLKSGGLMKIGLYSELARQHIIEMREEISKAGIGSSDAEMKSFRTMLINSDKKHHNEILHSSDFYSLSTLRDLLFHVQEHRFTIPQIQYYLSELGLKFCGFEADKIVSHFKLANTGAGDPYDLNKWQAYEEANPSTFSGMYQFWCQKIA